MSLEGIKQTTEALHQKYEDFSEDHPVLASMSETAVIWALRLGLETAADKAGIPLGHGRKNRKSRQQFTEQHPMLAAGMATVAAPITEELLFRELPSRLLERKGYTKDSSEARRAKLGAVTAFTAIHAGPDAIPLPQFIGGLNYSRIHEKRGLKPAIAAHITHNVLSAAQHIAKKRASK